MNWVKEEGVLDGEEKEEEVVIVVDLVNVSVVIVAFFVGFILF